MDLKIEILDKGLSINATLLSFPISLHKLAEILGQDPNRFTELSNRIYTWDDLGIYCYCKNKTEQEITAKAIFSFALLINKSEEDKFPFMPKKTFQGIVTLANESILERRLRFSERTENLGVIYTLSDDRSTILGLSVSSHQLGVLQKDKYNIPDIKEETIEFKDINFKYAIINELMYKQNLLQSKFDLYEFVELYEDRLIDLDEEGYDLVPEVANYFDKLPVPLSLAKEITEINQDGLTGIYHQLKRFKEGYNDFENIQSSSDALHFPNLKKAFFAYAEEHVIDELKSKGIDAGDWEY